MNMDITDFWNVIPGRLVENFRINMLPTPAVWKESRKRKDGLKGNEELMRSVVPELLAYL